MNKKGFVVCVIVFLLVLGILEAGASTYLVSYTRNGYGTESNVLFNHTFTAKILWEYETGQYITAYPLADVSKAPAPIGYTHEQYMFGAHSTSNGFMAVYPVVTQRKNGNGVVVAALTKNWTFGSPGPQ